MWAPTFLEKHDFVTLLFCVLLLVFCLWQRLLSMLFIGLCCSNAWPKQQLDCTHGMNIGFVLVLIIINVHACAPCIFAFGILYELRVCMLCLSFNLSATFSVVSLAYSLAYWCVAPYQSWSAWSQLTGEAAWLLSQDCIPVMGSWHLVHNTLHGCPGLSHAAPNRHDVCTCTPCQTLQHIGFALVQRNGMPIHNFRTDWKWYLDDAQMIDQKSVKIFWRKWVSISRPPEPQSDALPTAPLRPCKLAA